MNESLLILLLLMLAAVQILPLGGWLGPRALQRLYALPPAACSPDLLILLRHRALLLALPGVLLLWSIAQPALRLAALTLTALSMASFLWLAFRGEANTALRRVAWVDVGGLFLWLLALALRFSA